MTITVAAFTKSYAGRRVLDMPAFQLEPGTITAIIGANGSGKSTCAKVLGGVEPADDRNWRPPQVRVGHMPQKSFAFRMSVAKNIGLLADDPERAARLAEALGLDGLMEARAKRLSGGETAKMALARLLMGSFDLLILDEPTASMDMEGTLAAEGLVREYVNETGCAVLMVTHSLQQARRLADRVFFLAKGKLVEQGSAEEVLESPREEETRRFLEFYGLG